jgi:DNA-binding transcriptional regulator WhiA
MKLKISIQKQKIKSSNLNIIEKELAKLVGFLLTDGGVSKISGRYRIHYTSNSNVLLKEFRRIFEKLYGYKLASEKKFNATILRTWVNKDIAKELLSLTPSYRTLAYNKNNNKYPNARIPEFVVNNNEYTKTFLKYAFTADGSVTFYIGKARYGFRFDRIIRIFCEHPELRNQYYNIIRELGFKPHLYKDNVSLRGLENIQRFHKEIGFIENVKISGNGLWGGFTKSDLLKICLKSFRYRPSELGSTKEEIHSNLLKILASDTGNPSI